MKHEILDRVNCPQDLKNIETSELPRLCEEIRGFLIDNISKTGGHLAANLGIVEISVALCRLLNLPEDKVVYDVGHQSYVHKILTGRKGDMESIRRIEGISGFLRPNESPYDSVVSGHASTSISSGIGLLRGEHILGKDDRVVCVIGDGAMTGGMAYEALNDAGQAREPLIVIYNDNEMSISKNVGALTKKMSKIRLRPSYFKTKKTVKSVLRKIPFGEYAIDGAIAVKRYIRHSILKESIFEILGFEYLGPCDGNDINVVMNTISEAMSKNEPVVVHFKTQKGKGYRPSEEHPESYHGVNPFDIPTGQFAKGKSHNFSKAFGNKLVAMARNDKKICAVTAAMPEGTGLLPFSYEFQDRFFDVGIAEEHGVTMTAALAKSGLTPFFAVYATFLQRGFDQLIHDVAIEGLHGIFGVDRSGITGEDGETHQGTFDVPQLSIIPNLTILSPSSYDELDRAMEIGAYDLESAVAIRYPRGSQGAYKDNNFSLSPVILRQGEDFTLVSYGIMINEALTVGAMMEEKGIKCEVVKLNNLSFGYMDMVEKSVRQTGRLVVMEECVENGSIGQKIVTQLAIKGILPKYIKLVNVGDAFVPHGKVKELYKQIEIDGESVASALLKEVAQWQK